MQAIKSLYIFSRTIEGNKKRVAGMFLPGQLILGTGDKIKIYITADEILRFAKNNVEVTLIDKTNAEIIKRLLPNATDRDRFDMFLREGKIQLER